MTNELFLAQFRQWIARDAARSPPTRPGTGACTLATAMQMWLWTLEHLQEAKDADGAKLYQSTRQGVTFPLADALCWLLASRCQILDVLELEAEGPGEPGARRRSAGLAAVPHRPLPRAGGARRRRGRPHLRRAGLRLQPPSRVGRRRLPGLLPGRRPGRAGEHHPRHRQRGPRLHRRDRSRRLASRQGRPVRAASTASSSSRACARKLDGCLTGSQLAKDRAAEALHQGDDPRGAGLSRMSAAAGDEPPMTSNARHGRRHRLRRLRPGHRRLPHHAVAPRGRHAGLESRAMPGMPLQVICYERADDIGFGVSGVVTRARGIRASLSRISTRRRFPWPRRSRRRRSSICSTPSAPAAARSALRAGRSRSCAPLRLARAPRLRAALHSRRSCTRQGGLVLSIGQFNQWVGAAADGLRRGPDLARHAGRRAAHRGRPRHRRAPGRPGRRPRRAIRTRLHARHGHPRRAHRGRRRPGRRRRPRSSTSTSACPTAITSDEWAVGMKMVVDLPRRRATSQPGTVFHTFGYPGAGDLRLPLRASRPRRLASASSCPRGSTARSAPSYRYLQHFMLHPYLWRYLKGGTLRSWGAKSLQESGRRGEPFLAGDGYARIGEGSGSTNVLTGSGVDEAWTTGAQLAEGGARTAAKPGKPFTRENLEATYVARRRASWVETEGRVAEQARDGFHHGVVTGLLGMALAGLTGGRCGARRALPPTSASGPRRVLRGRIPAAEIDAHPRGVRRARRSAARRADGPRAAGPPSPSTASCWSRTRTRC